MLLALLHDEKPRSSADCEANLIFLNVHFSPFQNEDEMSRRSWMVYTSSDQRRGEIPLLQVGYLNHGL